jgi:hypothetical protein
MLSKWTLIIAVSSNLFLCVADAGGMGRLVSALIARGAIRGGAIVLRNSTYTSTKNYTPDVLTVDQLVQCLKTASTLDQGGELLEVRRGELLSVASEIDRLQSDMDLKRVATNHYSQASVDRFNAEVDYFNTKIGVANAQESAFNSVAADYNNKVATYNGECAKKYYADDMESARRVAGL